MKLRAPFIQLPFQFDVARLQAEVGALDSSRWRDHPQHYPGNFAVPLISVEGDPLSDRFAGRMRPTQSLAECPYVTQVLRRLGTVWGRSRLMKLSAHAQVAPHIDVNYYWRDRVRVHVPIITQPTVRFICGGEEVNMRPGECWVFDTWRLHQVINDAEQERIHLVADTVGSPAFWDLVDHGRSSREDSDSRHWDPQSFDPDTATALPQLALESSNLPEVMSPWELREHLLFLLDQAMPHEQLEPTRKVALRFITQWRSLWSQHGDESAAWPAYREALNAFDLHTKRCADALPLVNNMSFLQALHGLVLVVALGDRRPPQAAAGQRRIG